MAIRIRARYENEMLKLLDKRELEEGEKVEIEVNKSVAERTFGLIKHEHETLEEIIEDTEYGLW